MSEDNKPLYVGSSTNIFQRLLNHKTTSSAVWNNSVMIYCLVCDNYEEIEFELIRTHKPPHNKTLYLDSIYTGLTKEEAIGKQGFYKINNRLNMRPLVNILNARTMFHRIEYLIEPVSGTGEIWVDSKNVKIKIDN